MKNKNQHHVVPHPVHGWDVKKPGAKRVSAHRDTKAEAEAVAREMSRNQGTELVVHGRNGQIQRRDSHGNDPYPAPG